MFSLSHYKASLAPIIKAAADKSRLDIAKLFYELVEDNDLIELPQVLNKLAQQISPLPIDRSSLSLRFSGFWEKGHTPPTYLTAYYQILLTHLNNELKPQAEKFAQIFRKLADVIQPGINTLASQQKAVEDADDNFYKDIGDLKDFEIIRKDCADRIERLKSEYISSLELYFYEIDNNLFEKIKALIIILKDKLFQENYEFRRREIEDEAEASDESDVESDNEIEKSEKDRSSEQPMYNVLADMERRKNAEKSPSSQEAKDTPAEKKKEEKSFAEFFDYAHPTALAPFTQNSALVTDELKDLAKKTLVATETKLSDNLRRAKIIQGGLVGFGMDCLKIESLFACKSREILEETSALSQQSDIAISLDESQKKILLDSAKIYLQLVAPLISNEISALKIRNPGLEKDLEDVNHLAQEISNHIGTIPGENNSEGLLLLIKLRNLVMGMLLKRKSSASILRRKVGEIEEFAQAFILAITQTDIIAITQTDIPTVMQTDLKDKDYEKKFYDIFAKFINSISTCDEREIRNIFNELLMNFPLNQLDKTRYALKLLTDKLGNINKTFCDEGKTNIPEISRKFIETIFTPDFDFKGKLLEETNGFFRQCGLVVEVLFALPELLYVYPLGSERERLRAISAAFEYHGYLDNIKKERSDLLVPIEEIQKQTKSFMQDLLMLDLYNEDNHPKVAEIIETMRSTLKDAATYKTSLLAHYAWILQPSTYLPAMFFGSSAPPKPPEHKEKGLANLQGQFTSLKRPGKQ